MLLAQGLQHRRICFHFHMLGVVKECQVPYLSYLHPGPSVPASYTLTYPLSHTSSNPTALHAPAPPSVTHCLYSFAGDDSVPRLLFSSYHAGHPILAKQRTKVFQMSAFKDDQSPEAQKHMIGDIRRAIEHGHTCFLMYTEPIHGSLYDLFNQFFTVQRDRDQNAKLYVQIGIGSYSKVSPGQKCSHQPGLL